MSIRKQRSLFLMVVVAAIVSLATVAISQNKNFGTKGPKSNTLTVTGCLQKGDEPDEWSITGANNKTYGLRSSTVKLGDHLGHRVTVTGRLVREEENEANEPKENERQEKKEAGDLQVTKLKMISDSCK